MNQQLPKKRTLLFYNRRWACSTLLFLPEIYGWRCWRRGREVNIERKPYQVADIPVPSKFEDLIDEARNTVDTGTPQIPLLYPPFC